MRSLEIVRTLGDTAVAVVATTWTTEPWTLPLTLASAGGTATKATVARANARSIGRRIRHPALPFPFILPTFGLTPGSKTVKTLRICCEGLNNL
jgi:hypothetical protein